MRAPGAALLFLFAGCVTAPVRPERPRLTIEQVTARVPEKVADRAGWAADVLAALDEQELPADPETVCQVLAVIEQESGFLADPAVAGLAKLIKAELEKKTAKLGPLGHRRCTSCSAAARRGASAASRSAWAR